MSDRAGSTAAIVLAAGASRRLGQPKQLLPLGDGTVLDATLAVVRRCDFDRRVVTLGAAADEIRTRVDLDGFEVAEVAAPVATTIATTEQPGCSASIGAALQALEGQVDAAVLFLGDQPGVEPATVKTLREHCETNHHLTGRSGSRATIGVCRYHDGIGHPFWFDSSMFSTLAGLQGDKATWKVIESGQWPVAEVAIDRSIPLDVDTWDDYERLLNSFPASLRASFRDRSPKTLESRPS